MKNAKFIKRLQKIREDMQTEIDAIEAKKDELDDDISTLEEAIGDIEGIEMNLDSF